MPAPGSCHFRVAANGGQLPDPRCTPGATDPAVTPGDITSTICRPGGYTVAVRPPERITEQAKKQLMAAYGVPWPQARHYELDHLIELSAAGASDVRNLWPEKDTLTRYRASRYVHNDKDAVEAITHDAICAGPATLNAVQHDVAYDWTTALRRLHMPARWGRPGEGSEGGERGTPAPADPCVHGPWRVTGLESVGQGCGIARRWALTYSTMGTVWAPLAYLALPLLWPAMLAVVALNAPALVQCGPAAAIVPHVARGGKPRTAVRLVLGGLPVVVVLGWLGVSVAALELGPEPVTGRVVECVIGAVALSAALAVGDYVVPAGVRLLRHRRRFAAWKAQIEAQTGQPVVLGSIFGAWPRGAGAGTALLTYLQLEHRSGGQAFIGLARTRRVAAAYRVLGASASPTDWRLIAWLPGR